ncbi:MAG: hypothetical protein GF311_07625 [Candidatus Lokiarchaeota archaeon]|nr:hypothetical protein [Candidatus Lokiarchaeota archaeon]
MKEKIMDYEIEEILRDFPRKLVPLGEIKTKINSNRKKRNKSSVSKTTVYVKLEKMTKQNKIYHIKRKGYGQYNYEFNEKDPNFYLFDVYKKILGIIGTINVKKSGKLDESSALLENFEEDLDLNDWEKLKDNFNNLIDQGILELRYHHKKFGSNLCVNYSWARYHNLCPVCLDKIKLNKPHFVLEILDDDITYMQFTRTHLRCVENVLNSYELKMEYESESTYYPIKEYKFNEFTSIYFTCPMCGLTLDIFELFFDENGPLKEIYKRFRNKTDDIQIMDYLQNLSKELFGDISTLTWAKEIRHKKARLVIKKIVMLNRIAYHPNCALKLHEKEMEWKRLSNNQKRKER